ncbi:MAG: hypothetical protein SPI59_06575, partial [Finegoldia sp.]|nr:hypothetical protein [Finegoldia sp.]
VKHLFILILYQEMKKMKIENQQEFLSNIETLTLDELYLVRDWLKTKDEYGKFAKLNLLNIEIEAKEARRERAKLYEDDEEIL